jgi:hypothetical protein
VGFAAKPMRYFRCNRALGRERIEIAPNEFQQDVSEFRIGQTSEVLLQATR